MDDGSSASLQSDPRHRVTNACEACRAAKVRCQASKQLGICRRCLESKRECVFKTGPRTRRPRQSKQNPTAERPPPPPGPSKTFTIDVPLDRADEAIDSLEMLRDSHEAMLERFIPSLPDDGGGDGDGSIMSTTPSRTTPSLSSGASITTTTTTSASSNPTSSNSATQLGMRRPQFNLDSAAALLDSFRGGMALYYPVAFVPDDATVPDLARERPFVLLAVLAAASGARLALQGHGSLYDEEFRKILGLKFVAGGERSVELLLGLLVYCAWYPVHLRPRNRQSSQYVRMAVDLVRDLELDQDDGLGQTGFSSEERLAGMRAYLACYYLVVARAVTWAHAPALNFSHWTARCCDLLEQEGTAPGDRILPWLVRQQHMVEEITALTKAEDKGHCSEYQAAAMFRGLEAQFREWRVRIPGEVARTPTMMLSSFTTEIYLYAAHLWKPGTWKGPGSTRPDPRQNAHEMYRAVPVLCAFLDFLASLSEGEFANFSNVDWGRFVFVVVVCFRLSFPLPTCPAWDADRARREIDLSRFLARVCGDEDEDEEEDGGGGEEGGGGENGGPDGSGEHQQQSHPSAKKKKKTMNVVSASQVVFRVVKKKYDKRVSQLRPPPPPPPPPQAPALSLFSSLFSSSSSAAAAGPDTGGGAVEPMVLDKTVSGCPMFDGSLETYFPLWDETFTDPSASAAAAGVNAMSLTGSGGGGAAAAGPPLGFAGGGGGVGGGGDSGSASSAGVVGSAAAGQQPPMVFHDLWATMTMGWTQDGMGDAGQEQHHQWT